MRSTRRLTGVALCLALLAGACGDDGGGAEDAEDGPTTSGAATTGFPDDRCQANRDAGQLVFVTSFDYSAAASIIDVVVAEEQGFFEDVCLDVALQAGFSTANVPLLAAGQAQVTSLGSFSEVAVANAAGADIVAIAVEGKTSIEELLVEDGRGITELADLTGHRVGIKGAIPYSVRAMLAAAGVDESTLQQTEVGFNPVVLFETDIDALPVYKSNEPAQLDAAGYAGRYTVFDPRDDEVPASFAVYATSRDFAEEHPSAVADFLRAALHGFAWAVEHPEEAVAATLERSDPQLFFQPEGEAFRWATESALVLDTTPDGEPVGAVDLELLEAEVAYLVELGVIEEGSVDVASSADPAFVEEVTEEGKVAWLG
ncbi:MAG: hypothetical protein GEV08_20995 [Acidimicrobiia bacterium]|nr:hypothetical protein [Acidimicrobiia bacterium]